MLCNGHTYIALNKCGASFSVEHRVTSLETGATLQTTIIVVRVVINRLFELTILIIIIIKKLSIKKKY